MMTTAESERALGLGGPLVATLGKGSNRNGDIAMLETTVYGALVGDEYVPPMSRALFRYEVTDIGGVGHGGWVRKR